LADWPAAFGHLIDPAGGQIEQEKPEATEAKEWMQNHRCAMEKNEHLWSGAVVRPLSGKACGYDTDAQPRFEQVGEHLRVGEAA
jgi:hypothetical protein